MFLGFANFYWQFIKSFSKIVTLFTSMLRKTNIETATTTKSRPNKKIDYCKIESNNRKIYNQTRPNKFSKTLEKKNFFICKTKLAFS